MDTAQSPKLQHYWGLIIRLFRVISRTIVGLRRVLNPLQRCSWCILQSHPIEHVHSHTPIYIYIYIYINNLFSPIVYVTDLDNADDIALLANSPAQAESLLHSLEWAAGGIGLHVNIDRKEYMRFDQRSDISTLKGDSLKLVDKLIYIGSSVSSTENNINIRLPKTWTANDQL